jgi:hypothetical protein
VARVSGPGEGYSKHFVISVEVSPSLHPSPNAHLTMGVSLSLRERDLRKRDFKFENRLKTTLRLILR